MQQYFSSINLDKNFLFHKGVPLCSPFQRHLQYEKSIRVSSYWLLSLALHGFTSIWQGGIRPSLGKCKKYRKKSRATRRLKLQLHSSPWNFFARKRFEKQIYRITWTCISNELELHWIIVKWSGQNHC